ncbi:hypothetical protein AS032_26360 [Rhodococcus qingshengii]|nr:hypothetical protein AS032_26360 [Rhodococcus qingshengii]
MSRNPLFSNGIQNFGSAFSIPRYGQYTDIRPRLGRITVARHLVTTVSNDHIVDAQVVPPFGRPQFFT